MNILHVVQRYYPSLGGSEKLFQVLSEKFAAEGHKVTVFTTNALLIYAFWNRNRPEYNVPHEIVNGVEVFRFKINYLYWHNASLDLLSKIPIDFIHRLFVYPSAYIPDFFKKMFQKFDFDIVHATSLPYNAIVFPAYRIAKNNKIPFVLTPHVHTGEPHSTETLQVCTKPHHIKLMNDTDKIITKSEIEKRAILKFGIPESRVITIGNGVEPSELVNGNGERFGQKYKISDPFILHLCHLTRHKGTYFLIESMKLLWEKGLKLRLVLVGTSSDDFKTFFDSLTQDVKVNIIKLDHIPDIDKSDALSACEIFAMPSISDAFGLVYLEAWFFKKPVIGAYAGGVPEVIDDGLNGYLVPFNDKYMLAEVILKLHNNPQLAHKMGEEGYKKCLQQYTWDIVYRQTKSLYEDLIDKNQKR
ncbi:glycosyltransferase family 4 protein [bacterium]|nr:glycosyltransferase family 4 protein [bacterium]